MNVLIPCQGDGNAGMGNENKNSLAMFDKVWMNRERLRVKWKYLLKQYISSVCLRHIHMSVLCFVQSWLVQYRKVTS